MKCLVLTIVAVFCSIGYAQDEKPLPADKTAEQIEADLIERIRVSGERNAAAQKANMPKAMQRKAPNWIPPMLNIRSEAVKTGVLGFVDDTVWVQDIIDKERFVGRINVQHKGVYFSYAIFDKFPTSDLVDGKAVKLEGLFEVTGTDKDQLGETRYVFTMRSIPLAKLKALAESKTKPKR